MLIKKSIECPNCKKFKHYLIDEKQGFEGLIVKCDHCGKHHQCVKQTRHFTKWEEIDKCKN